MVTFALHVSLEPTYISCYVDLFTLLQERVDDTCVTISGGRVYTSSAILVWHMQIHALLEEHCGTFSMTVERCDMHQRAAIFRPFKDARLKFIRKDFDDVRMTIFRGQVHWRSI